VSKEADKINDDVEDDADNVEDDADNVEDNADNVEDDAKVYTTFLLSYKKKEENAKIGTCNTDLSLRIMSPIKISHGF